MTDGDLFPTETAGLAQVSVPRRTGLADGDTYGLSIGPVRNELHGDLRMLAYNRQAWPDAHGTLHDAVGYAILRQDRLSGLPTPVLWNDDLPVEAH